MEANHARSDLVRLAGFAVWLAVGSFLPFCTDPYASPLATAVLYLAFGGLLFSSSRDTSRLPQWSLVALLFAQTAAALLLLVAHPFFLMSGLFVIVGWQVALALPRNIGLAWIILQSLGAGALLIGALPMSLLVASVGAALGFQLFALATADLVRSERAAQKKVATTLQRLSEAQADLLKRARQDERLRIARDLHDELGHGLTALGMMAASTELAARDATMRERAVAVKNGARELLARVRSVVSTMRIEAGDGDDTGEIDLQRALHALSDNATGPLKFALTVTGDMSALPRQHAVVLLRLVQEAHTNALRHAGDSATRIVVNITRATGEIEVTVSDDGGGAGRIEFGNGLAGMEGRLREIGGALAARSAPGGGFQITARVPLAAP
jgi:signal transduction histidine kinase